MQFFIPLLYIYIFSPPKPMCLHYIPMIDLFYSLLITLKIGGEERRLENLW